MIYGMQNDPPTAAAMNLVPSLSQRPAVLVSEDHEDVLTAIGLLLKGNGFDAEFVKCPAEVLSALRRRSFDALLLDLNYSRDTTSGLEGLDLLRQVQEIDSTLPIIVMTAWGTIELAVEAMHRGACDFVQKPWDNARLLEVLDHQVARGRKLRETRFIEQLERQEAAQIQRSLLPSRLEAAKGLTITAATRAHRNVSGDYYDVIRLDEHRLAICIADVMGKGVGAALLMSNLQATVRMLAPQVLDPSELCDRLNQTISANGMQGRFITFFYCVLDLEKMTITYTNAGHNWPVLAHRDGSCERLKTDDSVLGTMWLWNYSQGQSELRAGDRLVLFTDGVTECSDVEGNEFGEEFLSDLIQKNVELPADHLERLIMSSAESFGTGPQDDATLLVAAIG